MIKTDLIKKYIVNKLEPYGFKYKGRKDEFWIIERVLEAKTHTVRISMDRFANNEIKFELLTDEPGTRVITPRELGINTNNGNSNYWIVYDTKSLISVLDEMAQSIIEYGLDALEELSVPIDRSITNDMLRRVYDEHKALNEIFLKTNNIDDSKFDEKSIEMWFGIIKQVLNDIGEKSKEDKELVLMQISAFLGEQLVLHMGARWELYKKDRKLDCFVTDIQTNYNYVYHPFGQLEECFKNNDVEQLKNHFLKVYEKRRGEEFIITSEMANLLYLKHNEFAEKYVKKNNLDIMVLSMENIDTWFNIFDTQIRLVRNQHNNARNILMEISSMIGVLFERHCDWKWKLVFNKTKCIVYGKINGRKGGIDLLEYMLNIYQEKDDICGIKEILVKVCPS